MFKTNYLNILGNIIIKNINIPKCLTMETMFNSSSGTIVKINLENIYAESLQTMKKMFNSLSTLQNVSFSKIYTPNLESTEEMFINCGNLTLLSFWSMPIYDLKKQNTYTRLGEKATFSSW